MLLLTTSFKTFYAACCISNKTLKTKNLVNIRYLLYCFHQLTVLYKTLSKRALRKYRTSVGSEPEPPNCIHSPGKYPDILALYSREWLIKIWFCIYKLSDPSYHPPPRQLPSCVADPDLCPGLTKSSSLTKSEFFLKNPSRSDRIE